MRRFEILHCFEHYLAQLFVLESLDDGRLNPALFYAAVEALTLIYRRVDRLFLEQRGYRVGELVLAARAALEVLQMLEASDA